LLALALVSVLGEVPAVAVAAPAGAQLQTPAERQAQLLLVRGQIRQLQDARQLIHASLQRNDLTGDQRNALRLRGQEIASQVASLRACEAQLAR